MGQVSVTHPQVGVSTDPAGHLSLAVQLHAIPFSSPACMQVKREEEKVPTYSHEQVSSLKTFPVPQVGRQPPHLAE